MAHQREFRDDIVAVAQRLEPGVTIKEIADDFEISVAWLQNRLCRVDVEAGGKPGVASSESAELRALRKGNRLLELESEILRREAADLSQAHLQGKEPPRS